MLIDSITTRPPMGIAAWVPNRSTQAPLLDFLQRRMGLSSNALNLGLRQAELEQAPLPVVLWSFGLLSLDQLQQVLDWQDSQE